MLKMTFFALLCSFCALSTVAYAQTQENQTMTTTTPVHLVIKTNKGDIKIELYPDKAPATVLNFLQYVKDGHYANTLFHRVIPGFMIQGGGFTVDFKQKTTRTPIKIESSNGLKNLRGTLAMARTSDPDSATSQFFINLVDNGSLDYRSATPSGYGYTVFGKVTEGMDVVDKIAKVKTVTNGYHHDVPADPVEIESVTIEK